MAWAVLVLSAALEAVWATALGASGGFTAPGPTAVFLVGLAASMLTLGYAVKHIPISTAYAIWAGLGAGLTVAWSMLTGEEVVSALRVLFLLGIVGSVVGLKLIKTPPPSRSGAAEAS